MMFATNRFRWSGVVAVLLALPGLFACTVGEEETRTLRIGNHAEPGSLDPHRSEGVPARNIQRDLFEGLVSQDAAGNLVPGAAERWETSGDGLRWTFHLRRDARWSNGNPVTAEDFVFSLRRAVSPDTNGIVSETLLPIRNAGAILRGGLDPQALGVTATGDFELVIDLEAPTPYLAGIFTHPSTFPVHAASIRTGENRARPGTLVSNGAYRLIEWRVHSHITLERNPYYRRAEDIAIQRVQYLPIEDERAELARFEAGDIHITYGVPAGRLEWLQANYPKSLHVHPWFGIYYLGLNTSRPPLDDARVRRALSLAVDRDVLAFEIAGSGETPAYNWIPAVAGYESKTPEWAQGSREEQVARARELLRAAGFREGKPRVELLYSTRDRDRRIVTAIASMWKTALGIETVLRNQEWKVYLQTRRRLDSTQVFRSGWIGEYPDPNTFAEILHSEHRMNEFGWRNPRYDALLKKAAHTGDMYERYALFAHAEELIQQDVPLIPLFHYAKARLVSPKVTGYQGNFMDHHFTKHYAWKTTE